MNNETIQLDTKAMDQLIKAFKTQPVARVGILGKSNARVPAGGATEVKTNAEIGAAHEFGSGSMPIRSFLRIPISWHLDKYLNKAGAFDKDTLKKVIAEGTIVPWWEKVAITAHTIVLDAFASGGFGLWPPSNMAKKKVHQTLVETQQLRNAQTWDVKEAP